MCNVCSKRIRTRISYASERNIEGNEWNAWIGTIRSTFRKGTILDYWRASGLETLLDPDFQNFVNNEIIDKEYFNVKLGWM
jgi:hypothetical protein